MANEFQRLRMARLRADEVKMQALEAKHENSTFRTLYGDQARGRDVSFVFEHELKDVRAALAKHAPTAFTDDQVEALGSGLYVAVVLKMDAPSSAKVQKKRRARYTDPTLVNVYDDENNADVKRLAEEQGWNLADMKGRPNDIKKL